MKTLEARLTIAADLETNVAANFQPQKLTDQKHRITETRTTLLSALNEQGTRASSSVRSTRVRELFIIGEVALGSDTTRQSSVLTRRATFLAAERASMVR